MAVTQPQPLRHLSPADTAPSATLRRAGWLYAVLLTALPVGIMAWVWARGAVNVPKWDDHIFKAFLLAIERETSPLGWVRQVLKQHNEHRIAYDRLLAWADYAAFGKLGFTRLMVYGNLSLLALVGLFGRVLARYVKPWHLFMPPVALLIVSLAQWENFFWALSSIQNFSVVFWALAALLALTHHARLGWAVGLGAVATLTSPNGFLVWPIGLVLLVAGRRVGSLLPWALAAAALTAIYFWDYVSPTTHPPTRGSFLDLAGGCLAFLGAAAEALPTERAYRLSGLLGGSLLLVWGVIFVHSTGTLRTRTGWTPVQAFGLGAVAFLVGTAVVVVWGRYGYGRDMLLTSRYRIYSLTLLALTYTHCLSAFYENRRVSPKLTGLLAGAGLLGGGLLWWSAFRLNAHESIALRKQLLTSQYNWTYTTATPTSSIDPATRRLIDQAPAFYDAALPLFFAPGRGQPYPVDTLVRTGDTYLLRLGVDQPSPAPIPSLAHPDAGLNVLLRSAKRTYLYGALPAPRRHWRVLAGLLPLYADGPIEIRIPAGELDAGTYTLSVVQYGPGGAAGVVRPTNQLLTAAPHAPLSGPVKNW